MHLVINKYVSSPKTLRSSLFCGKETDTYNPPTILSEYENENVVSFIDANKQERKQETAVKDFIIRNVLNGGTKS